MTHEPYWWQQAREMRAQGMGYKRIGRKLGKHHSSVVYAVNEKYRERKRSIGLENYRKYSVVIGDALARKQRLKFLEAARDQAKEEGISPDLVLQRWGQPARRERANV